jgi:hypothetical protein
MPSPSIEAASRAGPLPTFPPSSLASRRESHTLPATHHDTTRRKSFPIIVAVYHRASTTLSSLRCVQPNAASEPCARPTRVTSPAALRAPRQASLLRLYRLNTAEQPAPSSRRHAHICSTRAHCPRSQLCPSCPQLSPIVPGSLHPASPRSKNCELWLHLRCATRTRPTTTSGERQGSSPSSRLNPAATASGLQAEKRPGRSRGDPLGTLGRNSRICKLRCKQREA